MQDIFPGYYKPNEEEIRQAWNECLLVLDTNVLLNLYRYPKPACDALLNALAQITTRLWVPHQVALEYQQNRLAVIAEQIRRFDDVRKVLHDTKKSLENDLDRLQLKKRHSSIDPQELVGNIETLFKNFTTNLEHLENEQINISADDPIRAKLDELSMGRLGPCPSSQQYLEDLYKEGKRRYEEKIPPSYKDAANAKDNDTKPPV